MRMDAGASVHGCQSEILWGYKCELEGEIEVDHLFPYSLGGPSNGSNKLHLCRLHNRLKSSDIHFYPWEKGEPAWLEVVLGKIRDFRDRQR